ncbi:hypothetical protein PFFCH_04727 [Plasmodium falciparum FCH/4]|uniref:Surface antigen n=1 Tax=Plasmodium falciparum FCH/4 TaxID=1036724 RepID=A0A024VH62_PLAFA|nr:hypothetical protein PFFCH_04727 [Plasmodium falciparum FCH/4]
MYNEDYIITKVKLAFKLREHSQIFCINERDVFFKNVSRCYVSSKKNTYIKYNTLNTKLIRAHRTLCECELYALSNYDNDPEMKEVMQQFDRQSSQRFLEYDDRMAEKRMQCKDQCDKEIQKIILKDKLEKELMDKFATLQTDIQNDAIPTCVCEKSIADKVEKGCLKCAQNLGGIVVPSSGVLGGIGEFGLSVWKPAALAAAKEFAAKAGAAQGAIAGNAHGIKIVNLFLKGLGVEELIPGISKTVSSTGNYTKVTEFANTIYWKYAGTCTSLKRGFQAPAACKGFELKFGIFRIDGSAGPPAKVAIPQVINQLVGEATQGANAKAAMVASDKTLAVETAKKNAIETTFMGYHNAIIASIVAIIVIVLIMVGSPHKNPSITPNHPSNTRLLCDCELYAPSNYDNDPEMKEVMEIFDRQTSERFHEYDERMKTTRQKCKDKCDEAIQKIILKDKMEKQMAQQLTTLETKIDTNDIPTCICEKSLADKVEKNCLACGGMLSGGIAPTVGLIGSVAVHVWKPVALEAAIKAALDAAAIDISAAAEAAGKIAGDIHGMKIVILFLKGLGVEELYPQLLESIGTTTHYTEVLKIANAIIGKYKENCAWNITPATRDMCTDVGTKFNIIGKASRDFLPTEPGITRKVYDIVDNATSSAQRAANAKVAEVAAAKKAAIEAAQEKTIEAASYNLYAAIGYSILAILIIVLIMIYNQRNHNSTTPHHPPNTRSLCECKLYSPANYDSDPEMKSIMQQFEDRTTQRFHEYDERMKTTRQKCKEQCEKDIQKIILKDKLEKELMDKFATLQTDIQNDAIPTCICEKSLEDKMEKECLKCAQNLGGIVAPSTGVLGEIAALAVNAWKTTEIAAATQEAIAKGLALGKIAGEAAGVAKVIDLVKSTFKIEELGGQSFESFFTATSYKKVASITQALYDEYADICLPRFTAFGTVRGVRYNSSSPICTFVEEGILATSRGKGGSPIEFIGKKVETMVSKAEGVATARAADVAAAEKAEILETSTKAIETTTTPYYTPIIVSIVAIVVIILTMVIIYKILRYRRKKRMKKKLQYIKLLEE